MAETKKKMPRKLLRWRKRQKKGAIMEPETFEEIKRKAAASKKTRDAKKVAGAAYWKTAKAKFRERKKKYRKIKLALKR